MAYSKQIKDFLDDKNSFFSKHRKSDNLLKILNESYDNVVIDESIILNKRLIGLEFEAKTKDYNYLLSNQKLLEAEFKQIFYALKNQKADPNNQVFWFYCYYCATQLEAFHNAYDQPDAAKGYVKLKNEIKEHLQKKSEKPQAKDTNKENIPSGNADEANEADDSFTTYVYESLLKGLKYIYSIPFHISKIREQITMINLYRIYWLFSRLTLTQALTVADNMKLIEKLDKLLKTKIDVSKIIALMQVPSNALNYLSVAVFLGRFFTNAGMLLKHTFFPTKLEAESTTKMKRFKYEVEKRHFGFMNDLAWSSVNFLTNFGQVTKVVGPLALIFTSIFLTFDFFMILYKISLDKHDYLVKRQQYEQERQDYIDRLPENCTEEQRLHYIDIINKQIKELDRNWQVKESTLYFYLFGASLLVVGFTASFIIASPALVIAAYFSALLGMAVFLSADSYANYKDKQSILNQRLVNGESAALARREFEIARKEFLCTMVKNAVVPIVLLATFAICWPAAIVLTTLYLGYEVSQAYSINLEKKQLELNPPAEPEVDASNQLVFA